MITTCFSNSWNHTLDTADATMVLMSSTRQTICHHDNRSTICDNSFCACLTASATLVPDPFLFSNTILCIFAMHSSIRSCNLEVSKKAWSKSLLVDIKEAWDESRASPILPRANFVLMTDDDPSFGPSITSLFRRTSVTLEIWDPNMSSWYRWIAVIEFGSRSRIWTALAARRGSIVVISICLFDAWWDERAGGCCWFSIAFKSDWESIAENTTIELDGRIWIGMTDKGVASGLHTKMGMSASEMGLCSRMFEMENGFPAFGVRTSIISIGRENCVR